VSGTTYALVLDERGRRCPLPVITLARRIGEVEVGEVVAVLTDDPAARHDIPAWCAMREQTYLGETTLTEPAAEAFLVRRER
jgi:TusA-related sulfurtransferase